MKKLFLILVIFLLSPFPNFSQDKEGTGAKEEVIKYSIWIILQKGHSVAKGGEEMKKMSGEELIEKVGEDYYKKYMDLIENLGKERFWENVFENIKKGLCDNLEELRISLLDLKKNPTLSYNPLFIHVEKRIDNTKNMEELLCVLEEEMNKLIN